MIAAVVDVIDIGLLELAYQGREVLAACGDALKHGDFHALFFKSIPHGGGNAFTILLLVVDDGHAPRVQAGQVIRGHRALHAVQADGAEHQFVTTIGDFGAGGRRCDHQDAFVLVNV